TFFAHRLDITGPPPPAVAGMGRFLRLPSPVQHLPASSLQPQASSLKPQASSLKPQAPKKIFTPALKNHDQGPLTGMTKLRMGFGESHRHPPAPQRRYRRNTMPQIINTN